VQLGGDVEKLSTIAARPALPALRRFAFLSLYVHM